MTGSYVAGVTCASFNQGTFDIALQGRFTPTVVPTPFDDRDAEPTPTSAPPPVEIERSRIASSRRFPGEADEHDDASEPNASEEHGRIVALCRRRGFIFQSSEIYGGINGFWDYGPLGVELKNNLRDAWWHDMVRQPAARPRRPAARHRRPRLLDHQPPAVWEASGHVGGLQRPDATAGSARGASAPTTSGTLLDGERVGDGAARAVRARVGARHARSRDAASWSAGPGARARSSRRGSPLVRNPAHVAGMRRATSTSVAAPIAADLRSELGEHRRRVRSPCPECGGDLTEPRQFNLMFKTYVGAVRDEENKAYLRPETAQGIFFNFKNVLDTTRVKVPFGIAQVGKAFRNEVTPRNFIFRSREFEQMEIEFFVHPSEADAVVRASGARPATTGGTSLGLAGQEPPPARPRAGRARALRQGAGGSCDIEYRFPFTGEPGFGELEGIAHRIDFDLTQHQQVSGAKLEYFDPERERALPAARDRARGRA